MFDNKKVLVTGGSGMIGRQLVELLQKESADVYVADLNKPRNMKNITFKEVDLTNVVPPVSTSDAAFAAAFQWGPIDYIINVTSENNLAEIFGKPDADTAVNWLTASSFLS